MNDLATHFLQTLSSVVTKVYDECLHCTIAGNGELAKAANITTETFPRSQHEDLLDELNLTATTSPLQQQASQLTGIHLFWLFNNVYLLSPTATPDLQHALRRMACRVEWGELWKISRCDEPPMKPYDEALTFLKERLPHNPEWQKSVIYPLLDSLSKD